MKKGLNNEKIHDYFLLVMYELENKERIEDINRMLIEYERKELYLECAGILTALEWVSFQQLTNLIIEFKEYGLYRDIRISRESFGV